MWAIHNSIKGWTLYNLTLYEAQLIVHTLSPNEIRIAFVAQASSTWEKLDTQAHAQLFKLAIKPSVGFSEFKKSTSELPEDTDFFIFKPQRKHKERIHVRKEFQTDIIIEGQSQVFKTVSHDLSEGGIYLKDTIPDWVSGYFIVKIVDKTEVLQLICCLVEDQKVKQRVQVVSEENDQHFVKYRNWLQSK
jgi:hypothetical protein